ncbi:MAG: hypothetical protein ABR902_19580 [Candidatus Korobacteraceae bacterium]|jgi:hypothetical protein
MKASGYCELLLLVAALLPTTVMAQTAPVQPQTAKPAPSTTSANVIDCASFAASDGRLDLVSKLCEFALSYRHQLPDFIVQQTTTSEGMSKTVIKAQVTFQAGLEHYSNVTIDGRPGPVSAITTTPPNEMQFSSTGEFGPALLDLFKIAGATEFKFKKTSMLRNQPVTIYAFHVAEKKNVFWTFRIADGRAFRPEFNGEVWLQPETGRPLREEMEPASLPPGSEITSAKTVIDYAMTALGDAGTYLLPVKSESTLCNQGMYGMGACTTNVILFQHYRKFGATHIISSDPKP